jgi:hypothetical protein
MSYTMEGIVAAAPDFGIVPAGILAIFVFQYFPAHRVMNSLKQNSFIAFGVMVKAIHAIRTAQPRYSSLHPFDLLMTLACSYF